MPTNKNANNDPTANSVAMQFRVQPALHAQFFGTCDHNQMLPSAVVRKLMGDWVEHMARVAKQQGQAPAAPRLRPTADQPAGPGRRMRGRPAK